MHRLITFPFILSLTAMTSLVPAQSAMADQVVMPEVVTPVVLSNTAINRIACTNGAITDVFFSEEKGVKVTRSNDSAFIKFLIKVNPGGREEHVSAQSEFFVVCDGVIYTLVANPQPGPATTVRLSSPIKKKMDANMDLVAGMADEERIVFMLRSAMTDNIPESFTVESTHGSLKVYSEMMIEKARVVRAEGTGLRLTEYVVTSNQDLDLIETAFIRTEFGDDIAGVMVDPPHLTKGRSGRLLIVERAVN